MALQATMSSSISIPSSNQLSRRALIYFVPGNPGLIQFYSPFLTLLSSLLTPTDSALAYDIYGQDLLGFSDSSHEPFSASNTPWGLESQIQSVQKGVEEKGRGYEYVVLMGHSVGAYISVETFSRWSKGTKSGVELRNGVLLFPTLVHIAQSPSGRKLVGLSNTAWVADNAHIAAKALLFLVPIVVLRWILGNVMGFTPEAVGVTAGWLKSRDGIQQALYLGLDEMKTIKENVWEDDLWEASTAATPGSKPRFWLLYAQEDHWVDNKGRDEFLEKLGKTVRVRMEEEGVKHAFCTKEYDSWLVAKRVAEWVGEMDGKAKS